MSRSPQRERLERSLALLQKAKPGARAKAESLRSELKNADKGRGSATRGWRAASPQKGTERHELKAKCGNKCFLDPKNEGFPVCAALREGQGCKIDQRGVVAAIVRSAQYGRDDVNEKAKSLYKKGNSRASSRSGSTERSRSNGRSLSNGRSRSNGRSPRRTTSAKRR